MKDNFDRNFAIATVTVIVLLFIGSMCVLGYHYSEFAKAQQEYRSLYE